MGGFKKIDLKPIVLTDPFCIVTLVEHGQSLERAGNLSVESGGGMCT